MDFAGIPRPLVHRASRWGPGRHWLLLPWLVLALPAQDGVYSGPSFPDQSRAVSRMSERVPIFFPPVPPPLGRALPRGTPAAGRLAAPLEMAAYVNEPFYPPLATRLATKTLPAKLQARLQAYRTDKQARQRELREELERARGLPAADREAALAEVARRQAPTLAALEATAEQLRRDLIVADQSWGALRQWRLGDREQRGYSPLEIAQVMRASAYYQDGLLPAQRRLLREISLELQLAGENAEAAAANQPFLFFPPEPARVLLPDDIPADVSAKIAVYQSRKSALKKELYDGVYRHDSQSFAFFRGNTLKALAASQAPRLAELESLAEDIRRGLAGVPETVPLVERTPLPPVLHQRVAALLGDVGAAQREAADRVEALLAAARDLPMQATYRFETDGLKFLVIPSRAGRGGAVPSPEQTAQIQALSEKISAVAADYGRRLSTLLEERDAIRAETGRALRLERAERIDQAINTAMRVATARETASVYRDYRVALFQPGLSPEQRRLLFDGVMEQLELPLPRGELQPVYRAPTW
ncbi:MAG: hypothetical protein HZC55_17330 [Verrucomicrobia bacterium]|nr:hypothetical protein [Verrucomicrobiota bacterium]